MPTKATVWARIKPIHAIMLTKTTEKVLKDTDADRNLVRCDAAKDIFSRLGI